MSIMCNSPDGATVSIATFCPSACHPFFTKWTARCKFRRVSAMLAVTTILELRFAELSASSDLCDDFDYRVNAVKSQWFGNSVHRMQAALPRCTVTLSLHHKLEWLQFISDSIENATECAALQRRPVKQLLRWPHCRYAYNLEKFVIE